MFAGEGSPRHPATVAKVAGCTPPFSAHARHGDTTLEDREPGDGSPDGLETVPHHHHRRHHIHEPPSFGLSADTPAADHTDLLLKLEKVLVSTGKKTRFAPILDVSSLSAASVQPSRELVYHDPLAPPASRRRFSTPSVYRGAEASTPLHSVTEAARFQKIILETREINARHAVEHARCVELQLLTLGVTEAHRNDALNHLNRQTHDNIALRRELQSARKNIVNVRLSNDPTTQPGAGTPAPDPPPDPSLLRQNDVLAGELKKARRDLSRSTQREFGLAWAIVSQQEQASRWQATLQEASLREVSLERFKASLLRLDCAQREERMQRDAAQRELQTREWMMETQAASLKQTHEQDGEIERMKHASAQLCSTLFSGSGEALLRAEHRKAIELLESEAALTGARHAAELTEKEASHIRLTRELHALRTVLSSGEAAHAAAHSSLHDAQHRALHSAESASRADTASRESACRATLLAASLREERIAADAERLAAISAASLRASQAEARLSAAQLDMQGRLQAEKLRADLAEESVAARASEARSETEMLKGYVAAKEAAHLRTLREQEAELAVRRLQCFASLSGAADLECATRGTLTAEERQGRHRLLCDARMARSEAEKDAAESALRAVETRLTQAERHAEARDRMNAGLRRRLEAAQAEADGTAADLRAECDTAIEENSALRLEKGRMINKVAMAEAKAGWASARKTMIQDSSGGIAEELRREVVQLHDDLEKALRRPAVSHAEVQATPPPGVQASVQAAPGMCPAHLQTDETPTRACGAQTDAAWPEPYHPPPDESLVSGLVSPAGVAGGVAGGGGAAPEVVRSVVLSPAEWSHVQRREPAGVAVEAEAGGATQCGGVLAVAPVPPALRGKGDLGGAAAQALHAGALPWWRRYQTLAAGGLLRLAVDQKLPAVLGEDLDWVGGCRTLVFDATRDLGMVFNQRIRNRVEAVTAGGQAEGKGVERGMLVSAVGERSIADGNEVAPLIDRTQARVLLRFERGTAPPPLASPPSPASLVPPPLPASGDSSDDSLPERPVRRRGGGGAAGRRLPDAGDRGARRVASPPVHPPPTVPDTLEATFDGTQHTHNSFDDASDAQSRPVSPPPLPPLPKEPPARLEAGAAKAAGFVRPAEPPPTPPQGPPPGGQPRSPSPAAQADAEADLPPKLMRQSSFDCDSEED